MIRVCLACRLIILVSVIFDCSIFVFVSGETAFFSISSIGFANRPLNRRIQAMCPEVPITILYGSDSWVVKFYDFNTVKKLLKESYITINEITNASHHLYADQADEFNRLVDQACRYGRNGSQSRKETPV